MSKILPPVFLIRREPIVELLDHQLWADAQLRCLLTEADACVELAARKKITPAGARARLSRIARSMHQAISIFSNVAKGALIPISQLAPVATNSRVPVPHGHNGSSNPDPWRQWQWQATDPALGCLTIEACDWNEQIRAANLWVQRTVHRALTLRAAGEYLAVHLDGLERARKTMKELGKQLEYAANEFWTHFTLAEGVCFRRSNVRTKTGAGATPDCATEICSGSVA